VKPRPLLLITGLAVAALHLAFAQGERMSLPKVVEAGSGFSIQSTGNGKAALYLIGPGQVLKRDLQLGETTLFSPGSLCNAGHYLAVLAGSSFTETGSFDVIPASKPANLSFLAKPSRLPVGLHDGITGAVYVFDSYHNLITAQTPVSFELSTSSGTVQKHLAVSRDGAAWTAMDSTSEQGTDRFVARIGEVSSTRVVGQVAGDPCGLKMSARQVGQKVQLTTDPVRDCHGNAVPDGTVVTFTESYSGAQSTIDAPLKYGIAEVTMPVRAGATFSVASGVVMGNQIGWNK
jgi:hypothetical protein